MLDPEHHVCLSDGVNFWVGPVRSIVSLEQDTNYCKFTLNNGQKLNVRGALHGWEEKLPDSLFFRANRESIINMGHVKHMRAYDHKRYSLTMVGDKEIVMSRHQSVLFRRTKGL